MLDRARDYTTKEGAEFLAGHIARYWATRGRRVQVYTVQEILPRGTMPVHNVRSRMQGGWP